VFGVVEEEKTVKDAVEMKTKVSQIKMLGLDLGFMPLIV
jgi:hypothetical protein